MITESKLSTILKEAAQQVNDLSEQLNDDLWTAYELVGNLIFDLVQYGAKEPGTVSESCSRRISLTANMIQSFWVVRFLIASGAYWSASALLRQQMETLSRIIEYREDGNPSGKKPPNVSNLPFRMASNYGRLSQLCHTSAGEILSDFSECSEGEGVAATVPALRDKWAKDFFSLHVAHMLTLAKETQLLYGELHPGDAVPNIDDEMLNIAKLLVKTGFWEEIKEEANK
ncbi:MAG: hypothetical protein A2Y76_03595 [Planctomycetes bacterium RBG_13_60_9]|nr:MAG: hypothetical protein A2Y76_03595 [Planctomycetes bacterium RBG_13_60_9]